MNASASRTPSTTPRVAFLGLGLMGSNMARRLQQAGFPLTVYNRRAEKASILVAEGAALAASPSEAAENADIIISMVSDDAGSRNLWMGANGALATAKKAVLIESSTVSVEWIRTLDAAARAQGCALLDAPVTGSRPQAIAGELRFLVGGDAAAVVAARPVLEAMGVAVIHVGPVGNGARLKLINNFLVGVQAASFAEALAMIERGGFGDCPAIETILAGAVGSPLMKGLAARIAAGDQTLNFPLKLMAKDLGYARLEAASLGLELKSAAAAEAIFKGSVDQGDGDRDMSAVFAQFRRSAHPRLPRKETP